MHRKITLDNVTVTRIERDIEEDSTRVEYGYVVTINGDSSSEGESFGEAFEGALSTHLFQMVTK